MAKGELKLPKKILGVRVPKGVRQIGRDVLANPLGRELLAEALVHAAAGLLRYQSRPDSAARKVIEHPVQSGADAATAVSNAATHTASTVARAVDGLLGYLQTRHQDRPPVKKGKGKKRRGKKLKVTEARMTH
jgi:hypothetical protein